jgi:hypothetical protein
MRTTLAGLLTAVALLSGPTASASSAEPADNSGRAAFARLQSLIGEWEAPLPNNEIMKNIFRPLAFGTALAHEEWKNGEQLTATVFYVVGSELHADHFCDMGNQLHYVAAPSTDTSTFHFALRDATNIDTHPGHFRSTTWRLTDADHPVQDTLVQASLAQARLVQAKLVQDWEAVTPGKDPKVIRMEFKRTAAARDMTNPEAVVRADVHALNQGNHVARLALFSRDARVFEPSEDPDRLAGNLSDTMGTHEQREKSLPKTLANHHLPHVELHHIASAGDLVVAKLRFSDHSDATRTRHELNLYRVRNGSIQDLWHLARTAVADAAASRKADEIVRKLSEANNRGDLEAFLALFSPQAKGFHNSEPHILGDKPAVGVDEKARRDTYTKMFANGAQAQVQTLGTVALGNMIVAREAATLPTGKVVDELGVYRIENGLIVRDWLIFNQVRL